MNGEGTETEQNLNEKWIVLGILLRKAECQKTENKKKNAEENWLESKKGLLTKRPK